MKDNRFAFSVLLVALGLGSCGSTEHKEAPVQIPQVTPTQVTPIQEYADAMPAMPMGETEAITQAEEEKPAEAPSKDDTPLDEATQELLDGFSSGTDKVSYHIPIHRDTTTGQYADHSWYRYTIIGHIDGMPVVEQAFDKYTIAYLVDPDLRHDGDDVIRAWVGRPGQAPTEVQVPEAPAAAHRSPKMRKEPFAGLVIAGREYDGYVESPLSSPVSTRYWRTGSLPFDGLIQKIVGGNTTSILYGTDGKVTLDWTNTQLR